MGLFPHEIREYGALVGVPRTKTNRVWFVDSANGANGNIGDRWSKPKATLAGAKAVAAVGDTIIIAQGHAETLAAVVTISTAKLRIIGMGEGNARPAFTINHTGDGLSVEAADVTIEGIRFPTPTAAAASLINVASDRAIVRKCGFALGANVVDAVTVTAAGEMPTFEDNDVIVTADGPDTWLKFEGVVDKPVVRRNLVIGSDGTNAFDDGVIDAGGQALTNLAVYDNVLLGGGTAVTVLANIGSVVGGTYGPNAYGGSATDADNVGGGASNLSSITDRLDGATGCTSIRAAAIPAEGVSIYEILRQVYAALEGTAANQNGVATWPASAAPGNNVSIAEVLGWINDAIQGDAGIVTWANGAAPANGVSLAEGVRDIWDAVRNGTGGAEPATNKSVMDYLGVSPAFFVPGLGYAVAKTEDIADDTTTDDLFTVTGKVLITCWTAEVATDAIGAGVTDYKLRVKTDNIDLCAVTGINGQAVGVNLLMNSDAGDALGFALRATDTNGKVLANRVVGNAAGTCTLQSLHTDSGASTATLVHTLFYLPLEAGASVAAAA